MPSSVALMFALNVNSVNNVLNSGGARRFFQNASQDLLLALASILFSICIAFIPFMASASSKATWEGRSGPASAPRTWTGKMAGKL